MAEDLSKNLEVGDAARALWRHDQSSQQFIETLTDQELYADAIRVQARALPKPQAVAWACRCIRLALPRLTEGERRALERAEEWAREPTEDRRRAAKPASDPVGLQHPAGAVALAAFLSGGSLAPPHLPAVPPADHLTARAVAGAILLAAALIPEEAADCYRRFLSLVTPAR